MGELECHSDYLANGKVVVLQPPERHINHSREPNTYVKTLAGVRHVIALRDICSGEEITYDYRVNGYGSAVWTCNCGAARCRKTVHGDFFRLPPEFRLEYLPLLDDWFIRENIERIEALRDEGGA